MHIAYARTLRSELLRVLKKGSDLHEEKKNLQEEKKNPQEEKNEPTGRKKRPAGRKSKPAAQIIQDQRIYLLIGVQMQAKVLLCFTSLAF